MNIPIRAVAQSITLAIYSRFAKLFSLVSRKKELRLIHKPLVPTRRIKVLVIDSFDLHIEEQPVFSYNGDCQLEIYSYFSFEAVGSARFPNFSLAEAIAKIPKHLLPDFFDGLYTHDTVTKRLEIFLYLVRHTEVPDDVCQLFCRCEQLRNSPNEYIRWKITSPDDQQQSKTLVAVV